MKEDENIGKHMTKSERKFLDRIVLGYIIFIYAVCIFFYIYNEPVFIDNGLKSYYNDFKKQAAFYNVKYRTKLSAIYFSYNLPNNVAGQCSYSIFVRTLTVNANTWNTLTEEQKAMVVYHELGHCYLQREHIDETQRFNLLYSKVCPKSIMYPNVDIIQDCLVDNWEYYMLELYTNPNNYPLLEY